MNKVTCRALENMPQITKFEESSMLKELEDKMDWKLNEKMEVI
jgi:hypothetical protein